MEWALLIEAKISMKITRWKWVLELAHLKYPKTELAPHKNSQPTKYYDSNDVY